MNGIYDSGGRERLDRSFVGLRYEIKCEAMVIGLSNIPSERSYHAKRCDIDVAFTTVSYTIPHRDDADSHRDLPISSFFACDFASVALTSYRTATGRTDLF